MRALGRPTAREPLYTPQQYKPPATARDSTWRRKCPGTVQEQIDLYSTKGAGKWSARRLGPLSWETTEPAGRGEARSFRQALGNTHSCTCAQGRKDVCAHLVFVMVQHLGLEPGDELVWQRGWLDREVEEILARAPAAPPPKPAEPSTEAEAAAPRPRRRRPPPRGGAPGGADGAFEAAAPGEEEGNAAEGEAGGARQGRERRAVDGEAVPRAPRPGSAGAAPAGPSPFLERLKAAKADGAGLQAPEERLAALERLAAEAERAGDVEAAVRVRAEAVPLARLVGSRAALAAAHARLSEAYLCLEARARQYSPADAAADVCEKAVQHARAACEAAAWADVGPELGQDAARCLALALSRRGQHELAGAEAARALQAAEKRNGRKSPLNAPLHLTLGKVLAAGGQPGPALESLARAWELAADLKDGALEAKVFLEMARVYEAQGRLEQADDACERAKAALCGAGAEGGPAMAEACLLAGRVCAKRGDLPEAARNVKTARALFEAAGGGPLDRRAVAAEREGATLLIAARSYRDAEAVLQEVLAKEAAIFGALSAHVAETERLLGAVCTALKRRREARAHYARALRIFEGLFGAGHARAVELRVLLEVQAAAKPEAEASAEAGAEEAEGGGST
eukprot:tig00021728_g23300.t1